MWTKYFKEKSKGILIFRDLFKIRSITRNEEEEYVTVHSSLISFYEDPDDK
jgi:hypothetical protein